ncbi:MAG TPA: hypothetical protein VHC46_09860 [Thermodesulfobacteriota bacterium]|nr:hypothetical protein [Candidatus Paceibacterota bacterium]HVY56048.1 hypothetical protein [Thermodesulfobacteriota bacterium]
MFNIADYFKKFSRIESDSLSQRDAVRAAIYGACGADIPFDVKKGVIIVKGSPAAKSVAFTKKEAIIRSLREKHPNLRLTDVR